MKRNGESIEDIRVIEKILHSLHKRFDHVVVAIEENRDLENLFIDELNGSLQKRQLKVLEVGLLLHPAIPLEKSNATAVRLKETIRSFQDKVLNIGKNPEAKRMFCNNVVSLSWRNPNGMPTDVCHWADGFPLSIDLYISLLQCVFDMRDGTYVMDEVDVLLELMKKPWPTLGINRQSTTCASPGCFSSTRVAVLVLHNCYGMILKLYLSNVSNLSTETAEMLQRAEKLEKFLVQMVVEDCTEYERLKKGKACLCCVKETESWSPKSKTEPYAQSAVDLMNLVKETVDEFFDIPIGITQYLIQNLADSLGHLFQEYCLRGFLRLNAGLPPVAPASNEMPQEFKLLEALEEGNFLDCESRGQTAHHLERRAQPSSINKLRYPTAVCPSEACIIFSRISTPSTRFFPCRQKYPRAITERAQPLAVKEIMKACFEAFLMVLLAGGSSRIFNRTDHRMVEEDFECLKRVFWSSGEGLIAEDLVQREAEKVKGVIALIGTPTEQLIEEFSIVTCEASGIGVTGTGQKLLMPPTTRRRHRSDPNTILRVLCHRNDRTADHFQKNSFHLTKW
ncbi:hypothetical protein MLD38_021352 [Melastoma candidum]|uniref:Uncharacterized protein n=1 Tax=Melastoma candidum TaxID=119954 RepID=A0ACB9QGC8_9MYRT|nr:hypothetical protein MLD38_021352 [Melastoma candidum]